MLISVITAFVIIFSIIAFICFKNKPAVSLRYEHFLITGGSSGIGLAFACEAAQRGASVTILARNRLKLDEAKSCVESKKIYPEQNIENDFDDVGTIIILLESPDGLKQKNKKGNDEIIESFAADVTWREGKLKKIVMEAEIKSGPITFLVNCAGTSICNRFEETPLSDFKNLMDLNFMGSVNITQLVLPLMKETRKGNIIFFSSLAGLAGLYGYSAYSASKFALLGMAEALQMEVKPFNIAVTVSFPPDTNTPGYAVEILSKLEETKLISESAGLVSAEAVASRTLNDALMGRFMSSLGLDGFLMTPLCSALTPASYFDLVFQVLMMGPCRLIGFYYLKSCDRLIKKCAEDKKITEQEKNE